MLTLRKLRQKLSAPSEDFLLHAADAIQPLSDVVAERYRTDYLKLMAKLSTSPPEYGDNPSFSEMYEVLSHPSDTLGRYENTVHISLENEVEEDKMIEWLYQSARGRVWLYYQAFNILFIPECTFHYLVMFERTRDATMFRLKFG